MAKDQAKDWIPCCYCEKLIQQTAKKCPLCGENLERTALEQSLEQIRTKRWQEIRNFWICFLPSVGLLTASNWVDQSVDLLLMCMGGGLLWLSLAFLRSSLRGDRLKVLFHFLYWGSFLSLFVLRFSEGYAFQVLVLAGIHPGLADKVGTFMFQVFAGVGILGMIIILLGNDVVRRTARLEEALKNQDP